MFLLLPEYLVSILPKSRYLDGLLFCALLGMVLKLQCFKLILLNSRFSNWTFRLVLRLFSGRLGADHPMPDFSIRRSGLALISL